MVETIKISQKDEVDIFVFPYGIDDFMVFASVLKIYKEKNPNTKLFVLVLAPKQPAFKSSSYIKELADSYDFIDYCQEMKDIIVPQKESIVIDKKKAESYVGHYSRFIKINNRFFIEVKSEIVKDNYRYNLFFQYCTILGIDHDKPRYVLPAITEKAKAGAIRWLQDHDIKPRDKFMIAQLTSRIGSKTATAELFSKVVESFKLETHKVIEMNSALIPGSSTISPEEVSNPTLIELFRRADCVVSNNSFAYQIAGFLNKKTVNIVINKNHAIIRDLCFNFDISNLTFLTSDESIKEWDIIKADVPFLGGNKPFEKIEVVNLASINIYNGKQQRNKITRDIIKNKQKFIESIKNKEAIDPPLVWYKPDYGMLQYSGSLGNRDIKYQAMNGISQLLAYNELGIEQAPVKITNIYHPFW